MTEAGAEYVEVGESTQICEHAFSTGELGTAIKDGDTKTKTYAEFRGNEITFLKRPTEWLVAELKGLRNSVEDSCVLVENAKTGAAVRIEGDLPIEKFVFYATDIVVSPEPYVHIKLAPGAEKQWTLKYTLLVGETKSP